MTTDDWQRLLDQVEGKPEAPIVEALGLLRTELIEAIESRAATLADIADRLREIQTAVENLEMEAGHR